MRELLFRKKINMNIKRVVAYKFLKISLFKSQSELIWELKLDLFWYEIT